MSLEIKNQKEEIKEIIKGLCLFDDDLMNMAFEDNKECADYVLSTILGEKVKVKNIKIQHTIKGVNSKGRTIILDIYATLKDNINVDIEVQGLSRGASPKRARFHSSMLDSRMLKSGEPFDNLKPSYVIFICKEDIFKEGQAVYKFVRKEDKSLSNFNDGSYIYYVNGRYEGNDEIGKLIHDFHQTDPNNIHSKVLKDTVSYIKGNTKGDGKMCDAVDKYVNKQVKKAIIQRDIENNVLSVKNIMESLQFSMDEAFNALKIPEADRDQIRMILAKES